MATKPPTSDDDDDDDDDDGLVTSWFQKGCYTKCSQMFAKWCEMKDPVKIQQTWKQTVNMKNSTLEASDKHVAKRMNLKGNGGPPWIRTANVRCPSFTWSQWTPIVKVTKIMQAVWAMIPNPTHTQYDYTYTI